ncbi:MAG: phospholipase D family protein [Alcaligenes faecalis]|jgi:HKD family nuclease|nr:phospholipase D family protein [Alcaligenes faecalis]
MVISLVTHPEDPFRLGNFLAESLTDPQWTDFRAAVAFIKRSGTKHLQEALSEFVERGGNVVITAGVDLGGTTVEGLQDLLCAVGDKGEIFVFHNANNSTFHPKIYLFKNDAQAKLFIGSGNLTEGGLFTNYEVALHVALDLTDETDSALLQRVEETLQEWSSPKEGLCYRVTSDLITDLVLQKQLPDEAAARAEKKVAVASKQYATVTSMFKQHPVPPAPKASLPDPEFPPPSPDDDAVLEDTEEAETLAVEVPPPTAPQNGNHRIFLMTLQKTDVGVGQTTKGAQRRSPEIFIPLVCRDYDPEFWGWPDAFVPDPEWVGTIDRNGYGKMDRSDVMVRLGGSIFPVSIWYNPGKKDIRIRSENIRSAGTIGDILYLERADGTGGFAYYVEIIPQGISRYDEYAAFCIKGVRNSQKQWNYL